MTLAALINPAKALIFRITHVSNVPWILDHGLHCRSSNVRDPNFQEIGNPDLIAKRAHRTVDVAPGGTLADYIPFYFTPHSPMLLNIRTGYNGMRLTPMAEIAILVTSLRTLAERQVPFVVTDRHAYLAAANASNDLSALDRIDWKLLQSRDFSKSNDDPSRFERYQAEALVHRHLPASDLTGLVVHGPAAHQPLQEALGQRRLALKLVIKPEWYF